MVLLVPEFNAIGARSAAHVFPEKLAKVVAARWPRMAVGDDYNRPPCPPAPLLRRLLDILYLASAMAEEGRYPQFNVVAVPADASPDMFLGDVWRLSDSRILSVGEIHRLAPAVDLRKSAILVQWKVKSWEIAGLVDMGTSFNRARLGLQYHYRFPECLFIQIDRPGRMRVYQGQFLAAELRDGKLRGHRGVDFSLALGTPTDGGLRKLWNSIEHSKLESQRDYHGFQYIALRNTFAAIANCISEEGHGGAIIIVPTESAIKEKQLRVKYRQRSSVLRDAFLAFANARNRVIDFIIKMEGGDNSVKGDWAHAELEMSSCHTQLVEAIRFVARLSGCDGALLLSEDLCFLGFGVEIRSELKLATKVLEIVDEMGRKNKPLDVENFGLRHRSAIKLVSQEPKAYVLVVSQDGPISAIYSSRKYVVEVSRGVNLVNLNMSWS
jgi:hypothetical protein